MSYDTRVENSSLSFSYSVLYKDGVRLDSSLLLISFEDRGQTLSPDAQMEKFQEFLNKISELPGVQGVTGNVVGRFTQSVTPDRQGIDLKVTIL